MKYHMDYFCDGKYAGSSLGYPSRQDAIEDALETVEPRWTAHIFSADKSDSFWISSEKPITKED